MFFCLEGRVPVVLRKEESIPMGFGVEGGPSVSDEEGSRRDKSKEVFGD